MAIQFSDYGEAEYRRVTEMGGGRIVYSYAIIGTDFYIFEALEPYDGHSCSITVEACATRKDRVAQASRRS